MSKAVKAITKERIAEAIRVMEPLTSHSAKSRRALKTVLALLSREIKRKRK